MAKSFGTHESTEDKSHWKVLWQRVVQTEGPCNDHNCARSLLEESCTRSSIDVRRWSLSLRMH